LFENFAFLNKCTMVTKQLTSSAYLWKDNLQNHFRAVFISELAEYGTINQFLY
jgi:hypothetical protein